MSFVANHPKLINSTNSTSMVTHNKSSNQSKQSLSDGKTLPYDTIFYPSLSLLGSDAVTYEEEEHDDDSDNNSLESLPHISNPVTPAPALAKERSPVDTNDDDDDDATQRISNVYVGSSSRRRKEVIAPLTISIPNAKTTSGINDSNVAQAETSHDTNHEFEINESAVQELMTGLSDNMELSSSLGQYQLIHQRYPIDCATDTYSSLSPSLLIPFNKQNIMKSNNHNNKVTIFNGTNKSCLNPHVIQYDMISTSITAAAIIFTELNTEIDSSNGTSKNKPGSRENESSKIEANSTCQSMKNAHTNNKEVENKIEKKVLTALNSQNVIVEIDSTTQEIETATVDVITHQVAEPHTIAFSYDMIDRIVSVKELNDPKQCIIPLQQQTSKLKSDVDCKHYPIFPAIASTTSTSHNMITMGIDELDPSISMIVPVSNGGSYSDSQKCKPTNDHINVDNDDSIIVTSKNNHNHSAEHPKLQNQRVIVIEQLPETIMNCDKKDIAVLATTDSTMMATFVADTTAVKHTTVIKSEIPSVLLVEDVPSLSATSKILNGLLITLPKKTNFSITVKHPQPYYPATAAASSSQKCSSSQLIECDMISWLSSLSKAKQVQQEEDNADTGVKNTCNNDEINVQQLSLPNVGSSCDVKDEVVSFTKDDSATLERDVVMNEKIVRAELAQEEDELVQGKEIVPDEHVEENECTYEGPVASDEPVEEKKMVQEEPIKGKKTAIDEQVKEEEIAQIEPVDETDMVKDEPVKEKNMAQNQSVKKEEIVADEQLEEKEFSHDVLVEDKDGVPDEHVKEKEIAQIEPMEQKVPIEENNKVKEEPIKEEEITTVEQVEEEEIQNVPFEVKDVTLEEFVEEEEIEPVDEISMVHEEPVEDRELAPDTQVDEKEISQVEPADKEVMTKEEPRHEEDVVTDEQVEDNKAAKFEPVEETTNMAQEEPIKEEKIATEKVKEEELAQVESVDEKDMAQDESVEEMNVVQDERIKEEEIATDKLVKEEEIVQVEPVEEKDMAEDEPFEEKNVVKDEPIRYENDQQKVIVQKDSYDGEDGCRYVCIDPCSADNKVNDSDEIATLEDKDNIAIQAVPFTYCNEKVIEEASVDEVHVLEEQVIENDVSLTSTKAPIDNDDPAVEVFEDTEVLFIGNIEETVDWLPTHNQQHKLDQINIIDKKTAIKSLTFEVDTASNENILTQQNTSMSASTSTEGVDNITSATTSTKENHDLSFEAEQSQQKVIPTIITTVTNNTKARSTEFPLSVSYADMAKKQKSISQTSRVTYDTRSFLNKNVDNRVTINEEEKHKVDQTMKDAVKKVDVLSNDTVIDKNIPASTTGSKSSRFVPSLGGVIAVKPPTKQKSSDSLRSLKARRDSAVSVVDPHILVLTSEINPSMKLRQDKTLSYMQQNKIKHKVMDATDPICKNECTGLYALSRITNVHPQYFHVDASGIPAFCGTINQIELFIEDESFTSKFGGCISLNHDDAVVKVSNDEFPNAPLTTAKAGHSSEQEEVPIATLGNASSATTTAEISSKSSSTPVEESANASDQTPLIPSKKSNDKKRDASVNTSSTTTPKEVDTIISGKTDITVYGATSFVARHAFDYFLQVSLTLRGVRTITLAGRNESKLRALQTTLNEKMANLVLIHSKDKPIGKCVFDVFVADSSDISALMEMTKRTRLVANFAGPYIKYSEHVVASCAKNGTDYIDITGEVSWAALMRQRYGSAAEQSGARIISFCGYDSIPSDLAIFAAVDALRKSRRSNVPIEAGTCWHSSAGMVNGGTIHSSLGIPLNLKYCFSQPVPYLLDDPLVLTHPQIRFDPNMQERKKRLAKTEWLNQLPSFDSILVLGASASFFMAVVNAKIVHASSIALNYGPNFTYRERLLPLGMEGTRRMGILSIIAAIVVQLAVLFVGAILYTPFFGKLLADWLAPPGSGASDYSCQNGFAHVYAEVSTKPTSKHGTIDKGNCSIRFVGDPGNWVTAQCVCESALSLLLDRDKLPPRSIDGFGTPAELLGNVLLLRLQSTKVRPVQISTHVRKNTPQHETVVFV